MSDRGKRIAAAIEKLDALIRDLSMMGVKQDALDALHRGRLSLVLEALEDPKSEPSMARVAGHFPPERGTYPPGAFETNQPARNAATRSFQKVREILRGVIEAPSTKEPKK